ncbi:hypothetical protein [Nitratireductor sp. XY-223]|uniref:hypothetical protein n=1 Tax=Nitratireductor sp. XY-223 TaxID=2561926 RepID=UPI0010AA6978|nr:hypothetical protein [Nitratireductor sp. XY-223]
MPTFEIETPGGRFEVEAPDEAKAVAALRSYEPSLFERVGNATYDALNALGLPGSRMRRDITNLDNAVRGAADTLTFGTSDEIAARVGALFGKNYETELERQRAIDGTGGRARLAGQIAGGVLGGTGIARSGLSLTANAATAGKGFLPTLGYSALEGGAAGAAYGYGSGEGGIAKRAREAVRDAPIGAALGLGAGAVGFGGKFVGSEIGSDTLSTSLQGFSNQGRWLERIGNQRFYRGSDGSVDLGHMPPGVDRASDGRVPQGPVRMEVGESGKEGFGALHITPEKHQRARELGYRIAFDLVEDVAKGRTTVIEQANGRVMLVKEPGKGEANRYIITEFQRGSWLDRLLRRDQYHGVTTGFPESTKHVGKPNRTILRRTLNKTGSKKIWEGEP